jgi:phosphopentomutase
VRGVFNTEQTPEQVYGIALTSAFAFGKGNYGIGWDGRRSSAVLSRVVAAGVAAAGSLSLLFGLVPTPVTAFGTRERKCKLGFSVTASHNPPEYSGVKIFDNHGMELSKQDESRIERAMTVGARMDSEYLGQVTLEPAVLDSYIESMLAKFEVAERGLKIAVDCSNGPGALVTPRVLEALGHRVISFNTQISSRFTARLPEPTPQNLSDTASMIGSLGVDLGFAHDGDADRLVMLSSSGRILPDSLVSILTMKALVKRPGTVILSENTSSAVEEEASQMGARVVRSRIGKTFADIDREKAVFATEPSKIVNPDWGMWEDGMYAAVLIADAITRDRDLLGLLTSEPKWHYRQLNLPVSVDFAKLAGRVESEFAQFRISEIRRLDGLKVVFKDKSWIMFRASGTESKTRIYCESLDPLRLDELIAAGKALLEALSTKAKTR